jgi:hypothetical protein
MIIYHKLIYNVFSRTTPIVDPTNIFVSSLNTIQYMPPTVSMTSSTPMNALLQGAGNLLSFINGAQSCRVTSSVIGSNTNALFTTGNSFILKLLRLEIFINLYYIDNY